MTSRSKASRYGDGQTTVLPLAGRAHGGFNLLPESVEETHQALDGVRTGLAPHEARDMRLFDTEDLTGGGLRQAALLDRPGSSARRDGGSNEVPPSRICPRRLRRGRRCAPGRD